MGFHSIVQTQKGNYGTHEPWTQHFHSDKGVEQTIPTFLLGTGVIYMHGHNSFKQKNLSFRDPPHGQLPVGIKVKDQQVIFRAIG